MAPKFEMDLTRRMLLGVCAASAAGVAIGGAAKALAGEGDFLRPPGGQDEAAFIAACVHCDRCRSACHTGALQICTMEDGFVNARTPKFNMHRGYCDFCNACIDACSTGALQTFDPAVDKIGVAIVQMDRCMAYIQACESCKESCEYGALTFDSNHHPTIDADLCNGCGKCEHDCTALVYGTFSGGTRRGIRVTPWEEYVEIGSTLVNLEED